MIGYNHYETPPTEMTGRAIPSQNTLTMHEAARRLTATSRSSVSFRLRYCSAKLLIVEFESAKCKVTLLRCFSFHTDEDRTGEGTRCLRQDSVQLARA